MSFWNRLPKLQKFAEKLQNIFSFSKIDDDLLDELEMELIQSDLGLELTNQLINEIKRQKITSTSELRDFMFNFFLSIFNGMNSQLNIIPEKINVFIYLGVNGTGKTSAVGKMAYYLKNMG